MIKAIHLQHSARSAGRAALRLHNAFLESGIDSYIVSMESDINDTERIIHTGKLSKIKAKLNYTLQMHYYKNNRKEFGGFSYLTFGNDVSGIKQVREADIIYLHWVQSGFMKLSNIESLLKLNKPVVIFMHDMWSITGGCHYSFTCEKYKTSCESCPAFLKQGKNDRSARNFRKKRNTYARYDNLYFSAPSKWLYNCARQSFLAGTKPVFHIPNVIDRRVFAPLDKKMARRAFNIGEDRTIIAFGAVAVDSPYKGWSYLEKALEILKDDTELRDVLVLIFGKGFNKKIASQIPFETRFVGFLSDEYSTSLVYNAANVFVTPSLADNLPTTILESLCCETPVVGFNVGGIPDMIVHKSNGYTANYKDSSDLADGIKYCLKYNVKGYLPNDFYSEDVIEKHRELFRFIKISNQ